MFEARGGCDSDLEDDLDDPLLMDRSGAMPSSDRYGIMEKLKRLQEGEDLDDLLAEIDEELPSASEDEDPDEVGLTEVQKKVTQSEAVFKKQTFSVAYSLIYRYLVTSACGF